MIMIVQTVSGTIWHSLLSLISVYECNWERPTSQWVTQHHLDDMNYHFLIVQGKVCLGAHYIKLQKRNILHQALPFVKNLALSEMILWLEVVGFQELLFESIKHVHIWDDHKFGSLRNFRIGMNRTVSNFFEKCMSNILKFILNKDGYGRAIAACWSSLSRIMTISTEIVFGPN